MLGEKRAGRHSVMLDGQKDKLSFWVCARRWRQSFMTKQCACNSTRTNEPHKHTHRQIHAHTDTPTNTCTPAHIHGLCGSQGVRKVEHKNRLPQGRVPLLHCGRGWKACTQNWCHVQWNLAQVYSFIVWIEWIDHSFKLEISQRLIKNIIKSVHRAF